MKTMIIKVIGYLSLTLLFMPLLIASGEDEVLRMMVWEGYAPAKYVREFEAEIERTYGRKVKLEITYALSTDEFYNPIRDKKVDIITVSHHTIKDAQFDYITKGLFLAPDLKNIPNHANVLPDLKEANYHFSNEKIYGIPVASGPYGLAYNTKVFKQAPQSWKIFWDPAYKNRYVIGDQEYLYNINITALVMGYSRETINCFDALNNDAFKKRLRQLAVNSGAGWIGVEKPGDLIGMSFAMAWGDSLSSLERMGEIWKMAEPVEGTMWWIDEYALTWALADNPFLKKVAEEWINMSLSSDFQVNHLIRELRTYPVVTNIADKLTEEEKSHILTSTTSESFLNTRILQHTYSQRDRNGLRLMWDKAIEGVSIKRKNK